MPIRGIAVFVATPMLLAAMFFGLPDAVQPAVREPARPPPAGYDKWAVVTDLEIPVFDQVDPGRSVVGRIRRGGRVAVRPAKTERTCFAKGVSGLWLSTPGGYLCTSYGVRIGPWAEVAKGPKPYLEGDAALPFDYVKVIKVGSERYDEPIAQEEFLAESQTKAYFLAADGVVSVDGQRWVKTAYGEYLRADETRAVQPPRLTGVELKEGVELPIAFVVGPDDGIQVKCIVENQLVACGRAPKFSRFKPTRRTRLGDADYVVDDVGRLYPAENVRTAAPIQRPADVPKGARWVHIDLDEQLFVAYEGDAPRYTSLVSTGTSGHDTPTGLYQVERKYYTKTMRGPDDTHGRYRVEEIPWVMYYKGNYALHGAYWHEQFGHVRSHGCTNIAPVDAKWLFRWDQSTIPEGWHANLRAERGLYFLFTSGETSTG